MNKESMKQLIKEDITKKLGNDFYIFTNEVLKTNTKRDTINILKKGDNVSPAIFLEPYYTRLLHKEPVSTITDDILSIYYKVQRGNSSLDVSFLKNFENVMPRLFVKIINKHMNEELLKDTPYMCFLDDFVIVPYCCLHIEEQGIASFLINNMYMESWGIDKDSLITLAIGNTRTLFGIEIKTMEDILGVILPEMDYPPIYILSNKFKLNGAATILFNDVLRSFAKQHGNFYVIFSSINEVILIPDDYGMELNHLTSINQEVNETQIPKDELLGTKAYFFDENKGFVIK